MYGFIYKTCPLRSVGAIMLSYNGTCSMKKKSTSNTFPVQGSHSSKQANRKQERKEK